MRGPNTDTNVIDAIAVRKLNAQGSLICLLGQERIATVAFDQDDRL